MGNLAQQVKRWWKDAGSTEDKTDHIFQDAFNALEKLQINLAIAREARDQAAVLNDDIHETKLSLEQRALALFAGYVTVAIVFFAAAYELASDDKQDLMIASSAAGGAFVIGAIFFACAIMGTRYGGRGSDPGFWLEEASVSGDDRRLATMLAFQAFRMQQRIAMGYAANRRKARLLNIGVWIGLAATAGLGLRLLFLALDLSVN